MNCEQKMKADDVYKYIVKSTLSFSNPYTLI